MKLLKLYFTAVAIFATISAVAAEKNDTDNQIDIFKEWKQLIVKFPQN